MIFFDHPYVSSFLRQTIREHHLPVVLTAAAREFGAEDLPSAISEDEAKEVALATPDPLLYTVSESSLGWIATHLADTAMPGRIEQFKDKALFRRQTASLFPDFDYREVAAADLGRFDPHEVSPPFIIKPAVGFFSLGVKRVEDAADWPAARSAIEDELGQARGLFPEEVLSSSRFLIEPCIAGREYAVDAYYDASGEPVILSVLEHLFAAASDMSDRVYVTSADLVRTNLARFTRLLEDLGRALPVRNFAVHLELRVDDQGRLWPIEVNPARFGGWCTTADLTYRAYGVNPYTCFYGQERPDWDRILQGKDDHLFALVALGNSTGIEGRRIASFAYADLASRFENILELRRIDFRRYPIFGFLFTDTRASDPSELEWILHSDLREFITPA